MSLPRAEPGVWPSIDFRKTDRALPSQRSHHEIEISRVKRQAILPVGLFSTAACAPIVHSPARAQ
jgi:hypothetical protein